MDLEKRVSALEKPRDKPKKLKSVKRINRCTDHIIGLHDGSFFSQPRTAEETQKKLQGVYHWRTNRLQWKLLRLADRHVLEKSIDMFNRKNFMLFHNGAKCQIIMNRLIPAIISGKMIIKNNTNSLRQWNKNYPFKIKDNTPVLLGFSS